MGSNCSQNSSANFLSSNARLPTHADSSRTSPLRILVIGHPSIDDIVEDAARGRCVCVFCALRSRHTKSRVSRLHCRRTMADSVDLLLHDVSGIVRRFDLATGQGLITSDYGDFPVVATAVFMTPPVLQKGQLVNFDVYDTADGVRAVHVIDPVPVNNSRSTEPTGRTSTASEAQTADKSTQRRPSSASEAQTSELTPRATSRNPASQRRASAQTRPSNPTHLPQQRASAEQPPAPTSARRRSEGPTDAAPHDRVRHSRQESTERSTQARSPSTEAVQDPRRAHRPSVYSDAKPARKKKCRLAKGFDSERFEEPVLRELVCPICFGVLNHPVQTACDHLFCRRCIEDWLDKQPVCPLDRRRLSFADLFVAPRFLHSMLGGLRLRCDFAEKGCQCVTTLELLQTHVKNCAFRKRRSGKALLELIPRMKSTTERSSHRESATSARSSAASRGETM